MLFQKTRYRVKGKGINLVLSLGSTPTPKYFEKGEEFEAFHTEVPIGFLSLLEVLGPAIPESEHREAEEDAPEVPPFSPPTRKTVKEQETFVRKTPARKI